jgi:hypothetical protein
MKRDKQTSKKKNDFGVVVVIIPLFVSVMGRREHSYIQRSNHDNIDNHN